MPFTFNFGGFDPQMFRGFQGAQGQEAGGEGTYTPPRKERKPRKPIGNAFTRTLINIGVTLVFALVYFYLELPAVNLHAEEFYVFVFLLCAVYCGCAVLTSGFQGEGVKGYVSFAKKQCLIPFVVFLALIATVAVGSLTSWVVLRAPAYSELLPIQEGDFTMDIEEISYDQIPMLDADSASRLGNRKLGELSDMVSQFEILPTYNQINYQGRPVRVTSLRYGDLIKWFTNRADGLPAYIVIDMVTQEAEVVRLEEGMKYTPISISPEQAQFLETRKFQINEIARIFRVPPHMVGDLEKSSFSNIEQQSLEFVKYTLDPWVIRWEQSLQRALLGFGEKDKYFFKFNLEGLLRGDYQSRMNGYAIGRQNGWMSANDIRELENLDRIPAEEGGDLYLINGNMLPMGNAGAFANITPTTEGKENETDEEVLEMDQPGADESGGDTGSGTDTGGENTASQRHHRRRKLV